MNTEQDKLIALVIWIVIGISAVILSILLALIVIGQERHGEVSDWWAQASMVAAGTAIILGVIWVIVKAVVAHLFIQWGLRKVARARRKAKTEEMRREQS